MAEKCPYCGGEMEDWKFQGRREHGMVLLPRDYQGPGGCSPGGTSGSTEFCWLTSFPSGMATP